MAGGYNQWNLAAGASKTAAVDPGDPPASDGDGSYSNAGGLSTSRQTFQIGWPSIVGIVNAIKARAHLKEAGNDGFGSAIGVQNASGEVETNYDLSTAYSLKTTGALSRPGGGSWTKADTKTGVTYAQVKSTQLQAAGHARCTSLWLQLDYDQPGEAFLTFWSLLGPLIRGSITFPEFVQALDQVARAHPTVSSFSLRDARGYWRAFSAWRRPVTDVSPSVGHTTPQGLRLISP